MSATLMRAVLCRRFCEPRELAVEDVPVPTPAANEVRIAVRAAGLNFADMLTIAGKYQEKPPLPFTPGFEVAGEIDAVGPGVDQFREGDRVLAMLKHGGFAERAVAATASTFTIPRVMSYTVAAALPGAYLTAHIGLRHRARLRAGEVLLVHGAAGGTGLAAVQIGKILGATVIGSARGGERLALAKANGADCVVDNEHEDFRARVLELTSGRGADVIYDPVGGDAFDASLRCIAWEGRLIVIGFASGRIPSAPANRLLVKNCSVVGLYGGSYMSRDPAVVRRALEELFTWHGQGLLAPQVSRTFRLEDVGIAMETMLARRSTGRIVLSAAPEDGDRVGLVMVPAVGVHERGLSGG